MRSHGTHLQGLCVLLEQVVGHVGHGTLGLHGLLAVGQTQCQHHLVLPQGDGVDDGGLDLLCHHGVVVLQQADLRPHLQADVAGQLQIIELLLKAFALVGQITSRLCILRQAGNLGLIHGLLQLVCAHIGQLLLPARIYMLSSLK